MFGVIERDKNDKLIDTIYNQIASNMAQCTIVNSKRKKIYDPFDMPEEDPPLIGKPNADMIKTEIINAVICIDCNIKMMIKSSEMVYECQICGRLEDDIGNNMEIG